MGCAPWSVVDVHKDYLQKFYQKWYIVSKPVFLCDSSIFLRKWGEVEFYCQVQLYNIEKTRIRPDEAKYGPGLRTMRSWETADLLILFDIGKYSRTNN